MKRTLLLLVAASTAGAQVPLRGLAYDSLHGRPLSGAFVGIVGMNVSAMSDSMGRFVIPAVPKGTHRVVMQHDVLDAIGLSAAGARVVLNTESDSVIVAVPSFPTLWRAACGAAPLPETDAGFMFGTVARANQPVPKATVAASWLDLSKDSTGVVRQRQKLMEVDTDSTGNFALCGVPTTTGLSLRANTGASFGAWTDVSPLDKERIARRDLTIMAASAMRFDVPTTPPAAEQPQRDSTKAAIPTLDPVNIRTLGDSAMRLFEEHRKIGVGKFFTRAELEKSGDRRMTDLLGQLPGVKPQTGSGGQGWLMPSRVTSQRSIMASGSQVACTAPKQDSGATGGPCATACFVHVYLDDIDVSPTEVPNINRYSPDQFEGIEYYASGSQVPKAYNRINKGSCGLIVLHKRRGK